MQVNKPLTLRHNFSWTFIGNAVYAACQWGMLVLLAKLGNPEMIGKFTLGLAVTAPVMMFTNLQLRVIQATDAKCQFQFYDYLGLRILSTILALVFIIIIVLGVNYPPNTALIILFVGLAKAVESISDVCNGLLQKSEQMDRIAISSMLRGALALLLAGVCLSLSRSVLSATIGMLIAWIIVLVFYDLGNAVGILQQPFFNTTISSSNWLRIVQPRWHGKTLTQLIQLTLPMGIVMMLISLNTNIPRYFIEHYLGERELGIFAAIAYLMYAGQTVEAALGQSASPRLSQYYTDGKKNAFINLLLKLIGIGVLIGVIGIGIAGVAGKEILKLLYTADYVQYVEIFVWIMVTMMVEYVASFLCYGLIAARHLRVQVPLFITVTSTSAIACFWLVPIYGLKGAAISLLIATVVRAIISGWLMVHAIHKLPTMSSPEVS
ncbi:lipopolysaccharide biosynthesis protein [Nostoc sp. C052]|uniref:lipopolysaccharide biosynthesis protein n=1 Tax=Nostoc sp. C052 TaxID=2576902 RepID=UPI0015C3A66E|nr:oligosaccharide flippase family protein [Nostoc sp. C052]QLE40893.1 lipopolysaccharide biosynthesis protein [Nostoc sp. C052]